MGCEYYTLLKVEKYIIRFLLNLKYGGLKTWKILYLT